jgi:hypothetical protein
MEKNTEISYIESMKGLVAFFLIFIIVSLLFFSNKEWYTRGVIFMYSLMGLLYVLMASVELLAKDLKQEKFTFTKVALTIFFISFLSITMFGLMFSIYNFYFPDSFSGLNSNIFWEIIYYSCTNFLSINCNILPISIEARLLTIIEKCYSLVFLVFFVSNVVPIKDHVNNAKREK